MDWRMLPRGRDGEGAIYDMLTSLPRFVGSPHARRFQ
jgi:hypothetical protein